MDFYRVLWSRIGGRPWTYILRDTWHKLEGLWIIGLVAVGALVGHWLWDSIFWFLLVFARAILLVICSGERSISQTKR